LTRGALQKRDKDICYIQLREKRYWEENTGTTVTDGVDEGFHTLHLINQEPRGQRVGVFAEEKTKKRVVGEGLGPPQGERPN